jgi:hypothetical protein
MKNILFFLFTCLTVLATGQVTTLDSIPLEGVKAFEIAGYQVTKPGFNLIGEGYSHLLNAKHLQSRDGTEVLVLRDGENLIATIMMGNNPQGYVFCVLATPENGKLEIREEFILRKIKGVYAVTLKQNGGFTTTQVRFIH